MGYMEKQLDEQYGFYNIQNEIIKRLSVEYK